MIYLCFYARYHFIKLLESTKKIIRLIRGKLKPTAITHISTPDIVGQHKDIGGITSGMILGQAQHAGFCLSR